MRIPIILAAALLLAGCAAQQPGTNTNGTPVTAAEQAVGGAYAVYDGAVAGWITAMASGKVSKPDITKGEDIRKKVYSKLSALRLAAISNASNVNTLRAAFDAAMQEFSTFLADRSIPVTPAA